MLAVLTLLPLLATAANAATLARRYTHVQIQSARDGKCLSVPQPFHFSGTPVISESCDQAATWSIDPGSGSIILSGFNGTFALDAGSNPQNHGSLKVWQSYPGLYQQTWYWTNDNRIAITGGDQCLDEGDNGVQTYKCTTGNTNQVWSVITGVPTSTSSTSSTPTSTATAIPSGTVYPDPAGGGGRRIHWNGRPDLCVTIIAQDLQHDPADGTPVGIAYCLPLDSPNVRMQLWDLPCPGGTQQFNLHGGGTCLTAGATDDGFLPGDGTPLTVRKCLNEPVQVWKFESDAVQFCIGNGYGQCFNVVKDSKPGNQTPIQSLRNLQTWRAGPSDPQSSFFLSPLSTGPHSQC